MMNLLERAVSILRKSKCLLPVVLVFGSAVSLSAQQDWRGKLVGKPLYLRGFWIADQLKFDGFGKLINDSAVGPVTLSGIDVQSVHQHGTLLEIYGARVGLVADGASPPILQRKQVTSTTHIFFSLRQGDNKNFHASEQIHVTIQADANGNFEPALSHIFADGLAELASSVPTFWQCYARTFFAAGALPGDAQERVLHCVVTPDDGSTEDSEIDEDGATTPPTIVSSSDPEIPQIAALLGVQGTALIHLRVGTDGIPVGLQIVRPLGGGVDESILQAVSRDKFHPARKNGAPVPANLTLHFQVNTSQ